MKSPLLLLWLWTIVRWPLILRARRAFKHLGVKPCLNSRSQTNQDGITVALEPLTAIKLARTMSSVPIWMEYEELDRIGTGHGLKYRSGFAAGWFYDLPFHWPTFRRYSLSYIDGHFLRKWIAGKEHE